jgi:Zn-dependent protease
MGGVKIGTLWGIEVRADGSWLLVIALILFSLYMQFEEAFDVPDGSAAPLLAAAVATAMLFISVLIHELSHCLGARLVGILARSITLHFYGGLSWLDRSPARPGEEFVIVVAGPAANLLLGGLFVGLSWMCEQLAPLSASVSLVVGELNLVLAIFNIVPAFPLDGGRLLRSVLWKLTGQHDRATNMVAVVGQAIAALTMMVGLAITFSSGADGLWLIVVGFYLYSRARVGRQEASMRKALAGYTVRNLWLDPLPQIEPLASLAQLAEQGGAGADAKFMVVADGVIWGLVGGPHLEKVEPAQWNRVVVRDVMTPIGSLEQLSYETDIVRALEAVSRSELGELPVVEGNVVEGFVGIDSLLRFVRSRLATGSS